MKSYALVETGFWWESAVATCNYNVLTFSKLFTKLCHLLTQLNERKKRARFDGNINEWRLRFLAQGSPPPLPISTVKSYALVETGFWWESAVATCNYNVLTFSKLFTKLCHLLTQLNERKKCARFDIYMFIISYHIMSCHII